MLFRPTPGAEAVPPEGRRRLLDSPGVLTVVGLLLVVVLVSLFWVANRTSEMAAPLLSDVVLYALLAVDIALIATLGFVLARNLLKLWVERRQAVPFARFRGKLVAALLAMSVVPAALVVLSGSQIIRDSAARWFSEPVDQVLGAAKDIARAYYQEAEEGVVRRAQRLARVLPAAAVASGNAGLLAGLLEEESKSMLAGMVEVYRVPSAGAEPADPMFVMAIGSADVPKDRAGPSGDRFAARVLDAGQEDRQHEDLDGGGVVIRAGAPIRDGAQRVVGVVVVARHLSAEIQGKANLATAAFESYQGLRVLQGPIQGVYQSVFVAVSLLILISATWLGLYLAKRIAGPIRQLAEGAQAIGAGRLDVRIPTATSDELGTLVDSFNMMAAELSTSRERIDQSRAALERTNGEVEARRRYIETILERVATGVISLDAENGLSTVNAAAERLLGVRADIGQPAHVVFTREDLRPLLPLVEAIWRGQMEASVQEITLAREGREVHLAATATRLGERGTAAGAVLVLDDVTPLIQAQRVAAWRDVARRLAHEIKNPLTPIQLSAERLRRHFGDAPEATRHLVVECTEAIVTEVDVLKNLVDEFAQFARMRPPRLLPHDVNAVLGDTLRLYVPVLQQGQVRLLRQFAPDLPLARLDAEQVRQIVLNLVDNAIEALGGAAAPTRPDGQPPTITVSTAHDARNGVIRLKVADNGPGVPAGDRDKLFMPYYSTKGRGSGLGLAIVRRIIVEHGGTIEVGTVAPTGSVFTIELPCLTS